jgi:hypothetical protein
MAPDEHERLFRQAAERAIRFRQAAASLPAMPHSDYAAELAMFGKLTCLAAAPRR